jgi:acyl-CoA reductase-like NAD-dependent aldehyde dehydrogenase
MKQAADKLIPVELELGGKAPMIVFEDVNLERTVTGAIWGSFANCGQTCTSVERIFVQEKIFDPFVNLMVEKVKKLRTLANTPNLSDEKELDVGCMTAEFQIEEIESQLEEAKQKGANILCGGEREKGSHAFPTYNCDKCWKGLPNTVS